MLAGQSVEPNQFPGERIETAIITSDSPTFTTSETVVAILTVDVLADVTYRVRFAGGFGSTVANDSIRVRLRENALAGPQMCVGELHIPVVSGLMFPITLEAQYTAPIDDVVSFIVTGVRVEGTGNCRLIGASTAPSFLYVEVVEPT